MFEHIVMARVQLTNTESGVVVASALIHSRQKKCNKNVALQCLHKSGM